MKQQSVFKAWLKCKCSSGRAKGEAKVTVSSDVHFEDDRVHTVSYYVSENRIHESHKAVLVLVFKDKQGLWVRFPTDSMYKPFRVAKNQLKKAGSGDPMKKGVT
jgi:hypothetical protein